jgi:hypothetical protein
MAKSNSSRPSTATSIGGQVGGGGRKVGNTSTNMGGQQSAKGATKNARLDNATAVSRKTKPSNNSGRRF